MLLVIGRFVIQISNEVSPTIPETMTGEFNVAVAEFLIMDKNGKVIERDDGKKLAQWLYKRLETSFKELELPNIPYELWPPEYTGHITGNSKEQRERVAQNLAQDINAHIIIYGVITQTGNELGELELEFFVNYKGFEQGEEVTGEHQLGESLNISLPFDTAKFQGVEHPTISARVQALSLITHGLAYYATDNMVSALKFFKQAEKINGWPIGSDKKVIYLLLGNTYSRKASAEKSPVALPKASSYYTKALSIDDEYARAKVGEAGVLYLMAVGDPNNPSFETVDPHKLDEAEATFKAALTLDNRPESANIETKVAFGLGLIYFVRAQIMETEWLAKAKDQFEEVVEAYEQKDEQSRELVKNLAGHAHARLGLIARLEGNSSLAVEHYTDAAELVSPYHQAHYKAQLGEVYAAACELDLAIAAYEEASNVAQQYGDQESAEKYYDKLKEVKTIKCETGEDDE